MNAADDIEVLLLEDDVEDQHLLTRALRNQANQFVITWCESLTEAIDQLGQQTYDVILTDLSLPDSKGFQTVSELRKHCGQVPIIVLTALDDEVVERELLRAGAQDYLLKGELGSRAVVRAIHHAVHRQESRNEVQQLVTKLEQSQELLQQQAALLSKKNLTLEKLYKTAQELVDNVSHDFRTPLTVIKDYVSIMRERMVGDINEEQENMLDKVSVRADDLNNMVDDLLDVSKLESGLLGAWRRNVQVSALFEQVDSLLAHRAQVKNVEFSIECDPNLPTVYCDADKVGRVITNLAVNAIKFVGSEGQVRLWAKANQAGNEVVIGISDNGPGMEQQELDKIFGRFEQLNKGSSAALSGFGLGLNIALQLCRLNLGELSVESQLGKGSTFSFSIPIAEPTEILRRWLTYRESEVEALQAIEVTIDARDESNLANEFDSFLNYLVRREDLFLRIATTRWIFVTSAAPSESHVWLKRAAKEFEKANRNRPFGPLPPYQAEMRHEWNTDHTEALILQQFQQLLQAGATAELSASIS